MWCDEFETGLNIIIAIVQKIYEWPSCPLAKMISLGVHHFGQRTVWSLLYFLNYGIMIFSPVSNSSNHPFSLFYSTYTLSFYRSENVFVPTQKPILLNANQWSFLSGTKMFVTGTICKKIFGLTKKMWTNPKYFGTCKRTRHKFWDMRIRKSKTI